MVCILSMCEIVWLVDMVPGMHKLWMFGRHQLNNDGSLCECIIMDALAL